MHCLWPDPDLEYHHMLLFLSAKKIAFWIFPACQLAPILVYLMGKQTVVRAMLPERQRDGAYFLQGRRKVTFELGPESIFKSAKDHFSSDTYAFLQNLSLCVHVCDLEPFQNCSLLNGKKDPGSKVSETNSC